jgi:hypothetical protein
MFWCSYDWPLLWLFKDNEIQAEAGIPGCRARAVHDALAPVEVEKVLNLATTLTNQATTSTN